MKNPAIANYKGRPVVLFPPGWEEGWMHPEIEDGQIPLYKAEAYIAGVAMPVGLRHTYPFSKLPATAEEWRDWRDSYYLHICTSPFGYDASRSSYAPWGMSTHGVPKLHPDDE